MTTLQITTTDLGGTTEVGAVAVTGITTTTVPSSTTVTVNEAGIQGPPGPAGGPGPAGDPGPAGAGHDPVVFTQDVPALEWVIPHPYSDWPSVTVTDHLGDRIAVEIHYATGVVMIRTALPSTGRAYLI